MKISLRSALLILILIVAIGGFFRFYNLNQASFTADEFLGIGASYGYFKTGEWKLWDFNFNKLTDEKYTRAAVYYWQVAQVFKVLPVNEFSARLVSALWGLLSIVLIFFIARFFSRGNNWVGLAAAFLFAVSVAAIVQDRDFRMYAMFLPVYLVFSFLLYKLLESKASGRIKIIKKLSDAVGINVYYIVPALAAGWFSLKTHFLTVNIAAVLAIYLLVLFAWESYKKKKILNKYSVFLAVLVILYLFAGSSKVIERAQPFISWNTGGWSYLEKVLVDYSHWLAAAVVFVFGIYHLIKTNKKRGIWVAVNFLVPLFLAIFVWKRSAGEQYIFFIQSFKTIIIAGGLYFIFEWLKNNLAETLGGKKAVLAGLVIFMALVVPNFAYFTQDPNPLSNEKKLETPNYRRVFSYFLKRQKEGDLLITRGLRAFYFWGYGKDFLDFGGMDNEDDKLTLEKIKKAQNEHPRLWLIMSTNDYSYIRKDARDYIRENFKKDTGSQYLNDSTEIWVWEK